MVVVMVVMVSATRRRHRGRSLGGEEVGMGRVNGGFVQWKRLDI